MDPVSLAIALSLLSVVAMMAAIIYILTFILGTFSLKSRVITPKFVFASLVYFFGSTILLFMGVEWLRNMAGMSMNGRPFILNIGASAFVLNSILHILCGLLTSVIYLRDRYRIRK